MYENDNAACRKSFVNHLQFVSVLCASVALCDHGSSCVELTLCNRASCTALTVGSYVMHDIGYRVGSEQSRIVYRHCCDTIH